MHVLTPFMHLMRTAVFGGALVVAVNTATADDFLPLSEDDLAPTTLNASIVVDESVIRLGDLFTNAGEHTRQAVAYSPKPGKQSVFDARWLAKAASYYRVDWRPESFDVQSVVTRSSVTVTAKEITAAIAEALSEYNLSGDLTVELDNPLLRVHAAGGGLPSAIVEDIRYDRKTGRFAAIVAAPAGDPAATRMRVSGRSYRILHIPVLAERQLRDDIIREADIIWIEAKAERMQPDVIIDENDLIGMSPKRGLRAGIPIRQTDVRRPILVKRGAIVTIRLTSGGMSLSAQGRAQENGSKGDTIRVSNSQSSQVIEAEVDKAGSVVVRMPQLLAMN